MRTKLVALLAVASFLAAPAHAQSVQKFYQGRQVNLIVGFNPGGAYDPYARIVARHLPKYLPGSPEISVKNMQGAGSVRAANYLYNVAPKDGSELGLIAGSAALEPMFGVRPTQFEGQRFTWLGSANDEPGVCFSWHTTPIATAKDMFDKPMVLGASGHVQSRLSAGAQRRARHQVQDHSRLRRLVVDHAGDGARRDPGHVRHGLCRAEDVASGLAGREEGAHADADRA